MENLEVSHQFKATSQSLSSTTATHIACLSGARLQIRDLLSLEITRSIPLPQSQDLRTSRLAWSPPSAASSRSTTPPRRREPIPRSNRILVADDEHTRVYDLRDDKWNAVINNGSGGMGKNVHVGFGASEDEVVVWSDFASKVTVWCLRTGRTVEIKDPKFSGSGAKGWGYRPNLRSEEEGRASGEGRGGVMAMLCRASGQDVLLLLAQRTYEVIKRVELPTIDAAGLKWSNDGRWIAVWDSAASGYNLHVYTADGHLYRTITRELSDDLNDWSIEGLGIKSVEWVTGHEWLAVGGWDRRVRILSTRTFSPVVFLDHTAQIHIPSTPVYTESVDGRGYRSYSLTSQPATPPKAVTEKNDNGLKKGISILAFNTDGTLCATRDDSTPTTVWIWDLRSLKPKTILIQHSPIKSLQWHPTTPSLLLFQTTHDSPTLYLWSPPGLSSSSTSISHASSTSLSASRSTTTSSPSNLAPQILTLSDSIPRPAGTTAPRWDAKWLFTPSSLDKKPAFVFGHQQCHIIVWPEGKDQILRFESQEGDESDDSLYDILTGRTPVPPLHGGSGRRDDDGYDEYDAEAGVDEGEYTSTNINGDGYGDSVVSFEDTFRGKGRVVEMEMETETNGFDESGMDEMF